MRRPLRLMCRRYPGGCNAVRKSTACEAFRSGGEDRLGVGLHDADPMLEILRVIGAR